MTEVEAHARAANLVLIARDADGEANAVIEAALWALHFTPQVSLLPDGVLLNVSASLRLFGGGNMLAQQLRAGMLELGFTSQIASAPTATAAWLFARHADPLHADSENLAILLEKLPVELLPTAQPHLETLQLIGCQTIGQLRGLPRPGIARRFGKLVLMELDRAFGLEPEVHTWYEPPTAFCARLELPAHVESIDILLFAARRLLMQMTGWLIARHGAVSQFSLLLHHETLRHRTESVTPVRIALASPSRDFAHLTLLLREHLAKVVLSASVIGLSLLADDIVQVAAANAELFPAPAEASESVGRLIERLASRLGAASIQRLAMIGDHRPERCLRMVPALDATGQPQGKPSALRGDFAARPAWLLPHPLPLLMRQHKPFYQSSLTLLAGPERVEAGWWDDALAVRDYFVASNDAHLLLWIYRERPGIDSEATGWFLHGFFA